MLQVVLSAFRCVDLNGDIEDFIDEMRPVVIAAAAPFRVGDGYVLRNRFRWAVATAS